MKQNSLLCLFVAVAYSMAGCASESDVPPGPAVMVDDHHDHDHGHGHDEDHHHPETFAAAVAELTEMRNTIRDGFAKNDEEAAHGPLHEIGHLLETLEELGKKQGIAGDDLAALKTNVETLFNAFGDVDKTLHGGEGSTYSEVSEKIDAALAAITAMVKEDAHADHDHDHDKEHAEKHEAESPAGSDEPKAETEKAAE